MHWQNHARREVQSEVGGQEPDGDGAAERPAPKRGRLGPRRGPRGRGPQRALAEDPDVPPVPAVVVETKGCPLYLVRH